MTEIVAHMDAFLKELESTVTSVRAEGPVLDRTVFYPGGGGQPPDTGSLSWDGGQCRVEGIRRIDGQVVHLLSGESPPERVTVRGTVDWDRRYQLMRTHTALHILCGVIWRDFGSQVTGGNMKPLEARMDFELEHMSADFASRVEDAINAEVDAGRDVVIGELSREEAFAIPDLIRTKINLLPPNIATVRTVEIVGLDLQADGGTHVANTRDVGPIHVVGHQSKGKGNKRLRIALDPQ